MPMIYKRFQEKAAEEWRQIYKGLQLLEFLIKNGSERVIDDARSHLSLLKMLRQFHFIDQNGKDQGVNVRNRSKELAEMLSDVDRIRAERKKARNNRNKFGGAEGGSFSGGLSSGSKYGGFGSEDSGSYGAYSGGVFGDGGGFGGNTSGFQDSTRKDRFEEYDEFDEGATKSPTRRIAELPKRETKQEELPKKKEPEIDILGFDDDEVPPETPPKELFSNGKKAVPNAMDDLSAIQSSSAGDDDFDDFQSATPAPQSSMKPSIQALPPPLATTSTSSATQFAAPKPVSAFQGANLSDLVSFNSVSPTPSANSMPPPSLGSFASLPSTVQTHQQPRPTGYQAVQPNYFTSVPAPSTATPTSALGAKSSLQSSSSFAKPAAKSSASSGGDAFGSLWSSASAGAGIKKTTTPSSQGPNLASLAKEKASAGIWGASTTSTGSSQSPRPPGSKPKLGGGLDDLLG
ncbi:Epsin-3, clathrin recruitment and traffic between the Golgi and endosome [Sticta canariensis]|nr:Epsin-3, clathrin recruitment and traffic between the Golgi and endosome [Sticta canariensis]